MTKHPKRFRFANGNPSNERVAESVTELDYHTMGNLFFDLHDRLMKDAEADRVGGRLKLHGYGYFLAMALEQAGNIAFRMSSIKRPK